MTVAIMQPYIFPYLGYYQLVNAVDEFVFFDDVHFINKGWINRNNLLQQNQPYRFTIPLVKASQNKKIIEIEVADFDKWRKDFLKLVAFNYKKAPHFEFVFSWLSAFLYKKEYKLIAELAADSVREVAGLLSIDTRFNYSHAVNYTTAQQQDGPAKIIAICKFLNADKYINPRNGTELYEKEKFIANNIDLNFINISELKYTQFKKDIFVPHLSFIDILMFNSLAETKLLLEKYTLS